jgi:hypothetical protein
LEILHLSDKHSIAVRSLPILATIPRSGTWFLRYAISFLSHLNNGGWVKDLLTGKIVGNQAGTPFDFQGFRGGPIFHVGGTFPFDQLFIGHTVCPGFGRISEEVEWWDQTLFHAAGYDYFHAGLNYEFTPMDLSCSRYTSVQVEALERSAWEDPDHRIVLVYRNPIDQAWSYFHFCCGHAESVYGTPDGRPLSDLSFTSYLFSGALASYAKQFISYQRLAEYFPHKVRLVPFERLARDPEEELGAILDHLAGGRRHERPTLSDALSLARPDHLRAIECQLGRSLDGTWSNGRSHMQQESNASDETVSKTRDAAFHFLRSRGIDVDLIQWPLSGGPRDSAVSQAR